MFRRRQFPRWTLAAFAIACSPGCATIIHGTKQDVSISSKPAGANVSIDGTASGKTPTIAHLQRKHDHMIEITLEGYEPYRITLTRKLSGWLFGNIIFGGIIGFIVDPVDGAMYNLTPEQIDAGLKSGAIAAPGTGISSWRSPDGTLGKDAIYVAVTLHPDPAWRKVGNLERAPASGGATVQ